MRMAMLMEAFPGRLPSELDAEDARLAVGALDEVLEARAYLQAKRVVDRAASRADLPKDSELIDLVLAIEGEVAQAEIDAKRNG